LVDYYERSGQLDPGTFSNDLQLTQYLAQMAVTAQQPPAQPAPAPQPVAVQQPAQLATPGQQDTSSPDLIRAAEAMQTAGLLAVENGVWVARNAVASQLAEQMNARAARARMVQAELSDPTDFIRKYGAQAFESALAPFQQQLQQLMQQNQLLQQQIQANQPKPYEAFLETNKAALFTVLPDGKRNLLPAGHAYHNAWTAAADQGITDQAALHAIAQAACTPLLTAPAAPPAAPPPAPWISSVQPATDPSFNKPGTPLAQQGAPPALGLPTGNDGFPDFSQMARQLNSSS
jgi:hypothetical protein